MLTGTSEYFFLFFIRLVGRKAPSQQPQHQQASSSASNRGHQAGVAKGNKELDPFFAPDEEEPKVFEFIFFVFLFIPTW